MPFQHLPKWKVTVIGSLLVPQRGPMGGVERPKDDEFLQSAGGVTFTTLGPQA